MLKKNLKIYGVNMDQLRFTRWCGIFTGCCRDPKPSCSSCPLGMSSGKNLPVPDITGWSQTKIEEEIIMILMMES